MAVEARELRFGLAHYDPYVGVGGRGQIRNQTSIQTVCGAKAGDRPVIIAAHAISGREPDIAASIQVQVGHRISSQAIRAVEDDERFSIVVDQAPWPRRSI